MGDDPVRRHEILLQAALTLTSDLSLPSVLQRIVDLAAEVAGAQYGALGVLGPDGRHLQEFLTHGITEEQRRLIGALPEGHGVLGALITHARPLRLKRLQADPRSVGFPAHHPPMVSFLGVPIAVRGGVFGNLYLTEKQGAEEFTETDQEAVVTLAAHAAVAVENARLYESASVARRRLEAINEISQAILAGRPTDEVLSLVSVRARELAGARLAKIATSDGEGMMRIRAADGEQAEALRGRRFPEQDSISGDVVKMRAAVRVADATADSRVHQPIVRLGGFGPALYVPLEVRDRAFGSLALINAKGDRPFDEEDLALAQALAAQAGVALDNARILQELQRLALVEDRERIAKELHDDIVQSLFAEGMALQASLAMVDDPAAMGTRINQTVEHIDRIIRDLRDYIFALRPGAAVRGTIDQALRSLATDFGHATTARIEIAVDPVAAADIGNREVEVLQAAREALSNAVRHARANRIDVALMRAGDSLVLEVADDGSGFDRAQASGRGNGLTNLAARAASLGGELEIESERGRGTWVRIRIPLEVE